MKILGLHLVMVLALYGCSTMTPARYSISADTNQLLKQFRGRKAVLTELVSAASYEPTCRLMGPIQAGDGLTIPQFVAKAFNDELKFADLYDEAQGVRLSGSMDKVAFSSASGWWDLAMTLRSEKGVQFSVEHRYTFTTSFDAFTACTQTAQALGAATQDLIKKLYRTLSFQAYLSDESCLESAIRGYCQSESLHNKRLHHTEGVYGSHCRSDCGLRATAARPN